MDDDEMTLSGSAFQILVAATRKARLPTTDRSPIPLQNIILSGWAFSIPSNVFVLLVGTYQ